jgi:predicted  nucleic acid-binding Zn-ribbon protein
MNSSPVLPTVEQLKTYIQSEIQKGIEKLGNEISILKLKVSDLEAENNDRRATLNDAQDLLAKNCKKVTVIENTIFSHDSEGELVIDENDNPVFSQKLTIANEKPSEPAPEVTPVIETTKDLKACAVVEYLKTEAKPNDFGEFVIGRKELTTFMQNIVEEGLRVKKVSRQLKADIFERAVKLFPSIVYIKKSPSGNKTQMLALKTSAKSPITHGMTRTAPLGILA